MAIYRPSATVAAISGTVGGATFVARRSTPVIRSRQTRGPAFSDDLATSRAVLTEAVHLWSETSDLERTSWATLAQQLPTTNALGTARLLSGFNLFVKINVLRKTAGFGMATSHPTGGTAPAPQTFDIVAVEATVFNVIRKLTSPDQTITGLLYGANSYRDSEPRHFAFWRFLSFITLPSFPATDQIAAWDAARAPFKSDQWVAARFIPFAFNETPNLIMTATDQVL